MAEKFNFDEWIATNNLDSEETVSLVDSSDLAELQITKGQRKLLGKAIQELEGGHPKKKARGSQELITTSSLAKDSGLNSLLQQLENDGGLDAIINGSIENPDKAKQQTQEMGAPVRLDRPTGLPWPKLAKSYKRSSTSYPRFCSIIWAWAG